jgi:hypothetical protein
MSQRKQIQQKRQAYWRKVIQRRRKSGSSVREYCRRHKIPETSFYQGRRQLTPNHLLPNCITPSMLFPHMCRVEGWRGKSVSSPRLVKRSMRFSRTTLTYTLHTKVYVTYRAEIAFAVWDFGLRT